MLSAIPGSSVETILMDAVDRDPEQSTALVPVPARTLPAVPMITGTRSYEISKRIMDIVLGSVGLLVTIVLAAIIVPMILISSPGPVIFRQQRVGRGGKLFTCYKFRTMAADAEACKPALAHLNEVDGPVFKIREDPRQVRSLRWMRKFSIDELPQLWNVIRGDMSLVGPRPPEPQEVARYNDYQLGRLAVTPGMTCIWQVHGRSRIGFDEWVEMDLEYIRSRSTLLDLELLVRTIPAVITGKGAS